jgi:hypothetical protein
VCCGTGAVVSVFSQITLNCVALNKFFFVPKVTDPIPPVVENKVGCGNRNPKGVGGFQISGGLEGESEYGSEQPCLKNFHHYMTYAVFFLIF